MATNRLSTFAGTQTADQDPIAFFAGLAKLPEEVREVIRWVLAVLRADVVNWNPPDVWVHQMFQLDVSAILSRSIGSRARGALYLTVHVVMQQQDAFLAMAGQSMMDNDDSIDCNIFGGEDSCKTIPAGSKFADTCTQYRCGAP